MVEPEPAGPGGCWPGGDRGSALYLDLMKRILTNAVHRNAPVAWPEGGPEITASARDSGTRWPNLAATMVSSQRLDNVQRCLEEVLADRIPGDFIEAGVWRGGVCIFARAVFEAYAVGGRKVWVADSFEGVPTTSDTSHPWDRALALHRSNDVLAVSEDVVRDNFRRYGLLDDRVVFLSGWFADTLPPAPIDRLAVIRLDGDLHSSTTEALTHLYPKLSPGGFVIVDDYGIPGCELAVQEFRQRHAITDPLRFIDPYSVYWRRG